MGGCDDSTTEVDIMWTNQHGTGKKADHFVESQVIHKINWKENLAVYQKSPKALLESSL